MKRQAGFTSLSSIGTSFISGFSSKVSFLLVGFAALESASIGLDSSSTFSTTSSSAASFFCSSSTAT